MSYKVLSACGGLRYDDTVFTEIDGVLTDVNETELVGAPLKTHCGVYFDGGLFKIAHGSSSETKVITSISGADTIDSIIKANCSLAFDATIFELDENKALTLAPETTENI